MIHKVKPEVKHDSTGSNPIDNKLRINLSRDRSIIKKTPNFDSSDGLKTNLHKVELYSKIVTSLADEMVSLYH